MKLEIVSERKDLEEDCTVVITDVVNILDIGVSVERETLWFVADDGENGVKYILHASCFDAVCKEKNCLRIYTSECNYEFDVECTEIVERDLIKVLAAYSCGKNWYIEW